MKGSLEEALEQVRRSELERGALLQRLEEAELREGRDGRGDDVTASGDERLDLRLKLVQAEGKVSQKSAQVAELISQLEEVSASLAEAQSAQEEVPELKAELEELLTSFKLETERFSQRESFYRAELSSLEDQYAAATEELRVLKMNVSKDRSDRETQADVQEMELGSTTEGNRDQGDVSKGDPATSESHLESEGAVWKGDSVDRINALTNEINALHAELRDSHERESGLEKTLLELQAECSSVESLKSQIAERENEWNEERERLSSYVGTLEEALQSSQVAVTGKEDEIGALNERIRVLLKSLDDQTTANRAELESSQRAMLEKSRNEQELLARIQELELSNTEKESLLESQGQLLETLERDLESAKNISTENELARSEEHINLLQARVDEMAGVLSNTQKERDSFVQQYQLTVDRLNVSDNRIAEMHDEEIELRKALTALEYQVSRKEAEISEARNSYNELESLLSTARETIAMKDANIEKLESRYKSQIERLEKDVEDRIIAVASLEERVRECDAKISGMQHTISDLSSQLLVKDKKISEMNDSLQVALSSYQAELQSLKTAYEEVVASKQRNDELINEAEQTHSRLNSELAIAEGKLKESESTVASLRARAEEAETALSVYESKKKRDLEFLRKQNENISSLQRQIAELKVSIDEREKEALAKAKEADGKLSEAEHTITTLKESLAASQREIDGLKSIPNVHTAQDGDVLPLESNFTADASQETVDELREKLNLEQERYMKLEYRFHEVQEERSNAEKSLIRKLEEMDQAMKTLQRKVGGLEAERERLEEEVRVYTNQVADACREPVIKTPVNKRQSLRT